MKKNIKKIVGIIACVTLLCAMTGCAMLDSAINDLKGSLIGNGYVIDTYDNYGNKVMTTTGDKINIEGNPVEATSYDSSGDIITGYELSSILSILMVKKSRAAEIHVFLSRKDLMQKLIFNRKISTVTQMVALQTIHILLVS